MNKLIRLFQSRQALGMSIYGRPLGTDVLELSKMEREELLDLLVYREARLLKRAGIVVDDVWQHLIDKGPRPDEFNQVILKELMELLD